MLTLVCLAAVRIIAGQPMLEKTLKALAAPVGLVWMALFLVTWFSLLRRQGVVAAIAFCSWLLLTAGGNSLVVGWLGESLQRQYAAFDINQAEPVQILLVLGGGTGSTPAGNAQGGGAADRVIVAARMMLTAKAGQVVCSGTNELGLVTADLSAAEEMRQLLIALQVPDERITKIGGRNTREELEQFSAWRQQDPARKNATTGIVTSAWHMNRAIRLAASVGIEATAVPADFHVVKPRQSPHMLVPGAANLQYCQAFLFEYLAGLLNR
jgi:uncharacterized SAM-binding protein YcdF (DUF218 family)